MLRALNILEDDPAIKDSWSKPTVQMSLPAFVPRYSVGVNAARLGSNEPISSVCFINKGWYTKRETTHKR